MVDTDPNNDGNTDDSEIKDFVKAAKDKVNGRTFAQMRGEKNPPGDRGRWARRAYTRFGVWRRQSTQSAVRTSGVQTGHGGPGTFAYSPLDATNAGTPANTGFPEGGSASYTGETVALQNTTLLTGDRPGGRDLGG